MDAALDFGIIAVVFSRAMRKSHEAHDNPINGLETRKDDFRREYCTSRQVLITVQRSAQYLKAADMPKRALCPVLLVDSIKWRPFVLHSAGFSLSEDVR